MTSKKHMCAMLVLMLTAFASVTAYGTVVDGVFGLAPMPESASLAIWVPLEEGESILGIRWFNNDGDLSFPTVLAVAGDRDRPELFPDAVVVGEYVTGQEFGWSNLDFAQPLASATEGLYVIFELPAEGVFEGEGVGAGVGYVEGDGLIRSWIGAGSDDDWHRLSVDFQMAMEVVMNQDKSANVLVLGANRRAAEEGEEGPETPTVLVAGMSIAPNPFNPRTDIRFVLPHANSVKLRIFDVRGRCVQTLVDGVLPAGVHTAEWQGRDSAGRRQSSGVYFALLTAGDLRLTKRMILVK